MRSWDLKGWLSPEIVNGIEEKGKKFLKHNINQISDEDKDKYQFGDN